MRHHTISLIIVTLVLFPGLAVAQQPAQTKGQTDSTVSIPAFPYMAEITGDSVNIRSGPGTNYYQCGQLNKTNPIKVVGSKFSWSRIVPPKGSFSWVAKQYVTIEPDNPATGIITGDAVRVYAGSASLKPIHSTTVQIKLNRGDKVQLLGEETKDYHKIVPPAHTYLWVLTAYTKAVETVDEPVVVEPVAVKPVAVEPVAVEPVAVEPVAVVPVKEESPEVALVPVKITSEAEGLEYYYALQKQIGAERGKPVDSQNYAEIEKNLLVITQNEHSGKAARYAKFAIKEVERLKLALAVDKEIKLQDKQLQQLSRQIEQARLKKLEQVPRLGRFDAIGTFLASNIYRPEPHLKHYRISDDSGKTVCYAVPAAKMDLSKLIGKKVGLIGKILPHPETAGALVEFTEIVELK